MCIRVCVLVNKSPNILKCIVNNVDSPFNLCQASFLPSPSSSGVDAHIAEGNLEILGS